MNYAPEKKVTTKKIHTVAAQQKQFVLTDDEIIALGKWALLMEEHNKKPMHIEWAKEFAKNYSAKFELIFINTPYYNLICSS